MNATVVQLQQASSAFTLTDKRARADFEAALHRESDVVCFTEVAARLAPLLAACNANGYQLHHALHGDTALAVRVIHKILAAGEAESIPGAKGPASEGGHGPRPILWATIRPFETSERVTIHGAHWVTRKADDGHQQLQLTQDLGDVVRGHSRGSRVGFWLGDTNSPDTRRDSTPVDRALTRADLTSCWDELGKYPPTHGRDTIDVIGSYDPDRRVSCLRAGRWPAGNSDHRPVSAWYRIRPIGARGRP